MWIVYNWRSRPPLKQAFIVLAIEVPNLELPKGLPNLGLFWWHTRRLYSLLLWEWALKLCINLSSLQLSERSTDIDLVREAVHQKRSLRTRKASETRLSRGNSRWEKASYSSFQKCSLRENAWKNEFNLQVDKRKHVNRWTRSHICRHYRGTA